ncbi:MAG: sigma-54 dependent transcriptional regulator [Prevotellaceae bacterium]|jgi:transcriptional regulator with PAS, ATPase and Fis domain|nr:sigma-54 dependent transcriptional regulator [Prevotellaceae bacterium]
MMINVQNIKQQFDIIGSSPALDRGIDIACQVAPTDLSVLITGESGTGKEVFPKIIHRFSSRKHGQYIAVNCGAIPEGTIDSELFGHEKGSFTGALDTRKGYFEVVDGGTIFLDEVAELPLSTQVRLLRVLETGEFLKVGSSKMQKTNVRVIAATNVNLQEAIRRNRFREDLYYRLNTVPIIVPPLRERKEDIYLLFRKFASDFAEKYRMPSIALDNEARMELENYSWPGNVRQLKNVTEQISVIEHDRNVTKEKLSKYLPVNNSLPVLYQNNDDFGSFASERELLYKILFDMRNDVNELKKWMYKLSKGESAVQDYSKYVDPEPLIYQDEDTQREDVSVVEKVQDLQSQEKDAIRKVLKKFNNKRKPAAEALGISERTLYRKIKEYDIEEYEDE